MRLTATIVLPVIPRAARRMSSVSHAILASTMIKRIKQSASRAVQTSSLISQSKRRARAVVSVKSQTQAVLLAKRAALENQGHRARHA